MGIYASGNLWRTPEFGRSTKLSDTGLNTISRTKYGSCDAERRHWAYYDIWCRLDEVQHLTLFPLGCAISILNLEVVDAVSNR